VLGQRCSEEDLSFPLPRSLAHLVVTKGALQIFASRQPEAGGGRQLALHRLQGSLYWHDFFTIGMMNPGGSFILDPVLEKWMARKHCINQANVQGQRIKLCRPSRWCKPQQGQSSHIATATLAHRQPQLYFGVFLPSFSAPCHSGDAAVGARQGRRFGNGGRQGHPAPGPAVGRWAAARGGCGGERFLCCCRVTFTLGISGVCNRVVWSFFALQQAGPMCLCLYRLQLAKCPVLGRRAERSPRCPSLRGAGGRGGERAAGVTPSPGKGDARWHRGAGFSCGAHVEPLPQGGGAWVCGGVRRRGGCWRGLPPPAGAPASRRERGAGGTAKLR